MSCDDIIISNKLGVIQEQLGNIQQTLIQIQQQLAQRTTNAPSKASNTGSGTADSNRQALSPIPLGKGKPRRPVITSADQTAGKSDSRVGQSPHQEAHSDVEERGAIEDLFSDLAPATKGKRPLTDLSDSEVEPPQKKRRLVKRVRQPDIRAKDALEQSSSGENGDSPPRKLRRLIKGVRPSQQPKQLENSSEANEQTNDSSSSMTDSSEPGKPKPQKCVEVELPIEFSRANSEPLQFQFKIVCQLFVVLAMDLPADRRETMEFAMKQNYFLIAMRKMRAALSGLRDSLVKSQVWRPEIAHALETYPILETTVLEGRLDGCEACHLVDRVSSQKAILNGAAYDKLGFEPAPADPEEDEASDGETDDGESGVESDGDSSTNDDEDRKEFNVGRFCARRATVFHELTHWEITLFSSLSDEVNQRPAHLTNSNDIVEWLASRGVIQEEWQNIKELMERSRNLEVDGKKDEECIIYG